MMEQMKEISYQMMYVLEFIVESYAYMKNESYSLKLNPSYVEMIADELAYEIVKCKVSYNLPYL